jgi:DNA-binding transcriptional MerR regulator
MGSYSTQPLFTTGIASKITGVKPKTIINYDNSDLLEVDRTEKNRRIFSKKDLYDVLLIRFLIQRKNLTFEAVKFFMEIKQNLKEDGVDLIDYVIPEDKQKEFDEILSL